MSSIFSWIKKQLGYFINSIPEIVKGFVLFILAFSGLGCALILRYYDQSGTIIMAVGISIEVLAMIAIYFIFKSYFKSEESVKQLEKKQIKK
jgi:glucan phosphoethanolaminetransferase (alkaline phosphatase superfamily)